jgi:hypothetical protein
MATPISRRPLLCRLCGFPAADGGVRVSELNGEKLYEWSLLLLDTLLDPRTLEEAVFCQFCVSDARYFICEFYYFFRG